MIEEDDRLLDETCAWLTDAAVAPSLAEDRAVIRAAVERFRAVIERQRDDLARLRMENRQTVEQAAALRSETSRVRAESVHLRAERDQARALASQLGTALSSRVLIEQAKGMIAERGGVTVDVAFELLRKHARDHNARLSDVANAVVHLGLRL